ncbi:MAG: Type II secretion system protein G precursor [Acidobacteria bacterium ADurb.Bin340]|nr:MAG: Type II secretion system protein G precursor [Acidobacteria bacterium ADurb.Bin340]OQA32042.1 MAG: Type II secretion system protein G precursor [Acidobacteria bacterium ADurb.Bin340]
MRRTRQHGFTLVELILVVSILGIITAIAVPTFLGQRKNARVVGDAKANAKVMQMMLEDRRADRGIYGPAGDYNWTNGDPVGTAATVLPAFTPKGSSKMNFVLHITNGGAAYTIEVSDPLYKSGATLFRTNQNGKDEEL